MKLGRAEVILFNNLLDVCLSLTIDRWLIVETGEGFIQRTIRYSTIECMLKIKEIKEKKKEKEREEVKVLRIRVRKVCSS